jgi:hypothetical protein
LFLVGCTARPVTPVRLDYKSSRGTLAEPVVRARVNGHDAYFILDSGADVHLLTKTFAQSIGVESHEVLEGVPMVDVDAQLEGEWTLPRRILSVTLPARVGVEDNQLAGVISPQLLARDGMDVVIDVEHRTMKLAPTSARDRFPPETRLPLTACTPSRTIPSRSFGARALIRGHEFLFKVDTGRWTTAIVYERTYPFLDIPSEGPMHVSMALASDKPGIGVRVEGDAVIGSDAREKATCPYDGFLGFDVLHNCVLSLGIHDGIVVCRDSHGT